MAEPPDYQLFGLRVRSEMPLPELFQAQGAGTPDVTIRRGYLGEDKEQSGIHADGEALLLNVPNVSRYRIDRGSEIIVDPVSGVPDRNVRLFLLGSAFGALLHQRGLLPLHANAVEVDGRAVAFMGESGAGKSTLAAWFHDRGFRVIADDVCVVSFDEEGRPHAAPGLPRLRLWAQALELMGREARDYLRSYAGAEEFDKFDVPLEPGSAVQSRTPLAAVYLLDRGEGLSISRLDGIAATDAIFANTYRGTYVPVAQGQRAHWESAVRIVQATPVFRAARKWDTAKLGEQCALLLEHVRSQQAVQEVEQ